MSRKPMQPPGYWFDGGAPPLAARMLSGVYGGAVAARAWLYRRGVLRRRGAACPVIVVGNLIAGGSGKTPLVIELVERLREAGRRPGVASRGYGRTGASRALWVQAETEPATGGDEPVLIAHRTGAPVRVDRDRVAAARALAQAGCDVVVCDDGLQHLRLCREIEIEVVDGRRRYGNGLLLPAGPLREPAGRGGKDRYRVVNLGAEGAGEAGFGEWPMRLAVAGARPLLGGRACALAAFAGQRVHAVAGIGDPERFFATLRGEGIAVVPHAFPDHHRYTAADLSFGSDLPVLMTEKDAVKCLPFATARHFSVPVSARLPEAFWVALLDRLARP
ncbi:tetraacyldisaccharide 4'-kinase [Luteimonas sp. RD2P54]|uniref:Tetraacyldisaccharide 4'-kinase n=1 Tax=Luteimonas endophytica TaxID=3042023 RepID=A0ABT6JC16_9GAMM|nr:tetraacyldisaccharide 4'-kinase [Luteimonas endophytica]MDH5824354.1 tetraacyldisaccharide 4'-kinase [Luteimonas endophytica]